jgi:hypothetical protein
MNSLRGVRFFLPYSVAVLIWAVLSAGPSSAQQAAPKKATPKAAPKEAPKRPPLTEANLKKLWDDGDEMLLLNELKLRGLAFEPEEDWVAQLKDPSRMPAATAAIRALIPPAPTVDAVAQAAPELLTKIKEAAQKRNESDLAPLIHPNLLANKAKVYDLFDIVNYRNHSLGRMVPEDDRRVGVQFYQLTISQVERLHYLMISMYGGHIVLRDVITGPDVATMFLHDEEKIAISKLDLMFRALNDHDDSGLKNLCTPGMYDSLKKLTEGAGSTLVRGKYASISAIALTPTASLDSKSARVVVKVGYPEANAKPLEYYVDFERIAGDQRVVRVRDLQGGVVAWDPNIDNYLNERYGLPDGPLVTDVPKSDDIRFYPLSMVHDFVIKALESRNAPRLKELAAEFVARESNNGDGYGILAAAAEISGNYDEAEKQATLAIDRGGTAYFVVLRHNVLGSTDTLASGRQFFPVILGVSKTKIQYLPFVDQGRPPEEIALASITVNQLEKRYEVGKPRPFLNLAFGGKTYNFAAFGTACPEDKPPAGLEAYSGGSTCAPAAAAQQQQQQPKKRFGLPIPIPSLPGGIPGSASLPGGKNAPPQPMMVPHAWQQDLKVVVDAIDEARRGGPNQAAR